MKKIKNAKTLLKKYTEVVKERKLLEEIEKELKSEIVSLMEKDIETVGIYIVRNTPTTSNRLDAQKVKEFVGDDAVYASLCSKTYSHRFTVSI